MRDYDMFDIHRVGLEWGGRKLVLETFAGHAWRRLAVASTSGAGVATWMLALHRGSHRLRTRFAGADDLAPATSRPVTLRVR